MNEMVTLANIERRISFHIQGAYANILEVGRCLIEAKESGLVPHGEWEAWVRRTADMSERNAQRLMQAAREVSPDSAMAKLPISKITAILALLEPQREAVAEKAVEEKQSLRELNETIEAMKATLDGARQNEERLTRERDTAIEINNRMKQELADAKAKPFTGISHEAQAIIDAQKRELEATRNKAATGISEEARRQIDNFRGQAQQFGGMVDNLKAENERLAAQLADAEQMAEYQAREREKAQQELLDMQTQVARGDGAGYERSDSEVIIEAVGAFMAGVGYAPYNLRLSPAERTDVRVRVKMIAEWVARMEDALNRADKAVVVEGVFM